MSFANIDLLRSTGFINGEWWVMPAHGATFDVLNPATGARLAELPLMGQQEATAAVDAAEQALPFWSNLLASERAVYLERWHDLMMQNADDLARLMTLEQGKPLAEAKGEVSYAASFLKWFAQEGVRAYGRLIPSHQANSELMVTKSPVGVVAAITPWNFPLAMITRKAGPALAAGCTLVIKPAEATPLSALALAYLAQQAGIPKGVINVVVGDPQPIGEALLKDNRVRKLSFTGSTGVGKLLYKQSAETLKRLSLELGGNAPFIVFDDADLDKAVEGAIKSKFRNAGQTCVCANRFLVQSGIYDAFVQRLKQRMTELVVGNGLMADVDIGPLINEDAIDKVKAMVEQAKSMGAEVALGGHLTHEAGLFYPPTLLLNVTAEMDVFQHEIFGPVAPIMRFETEQDAVRLANATPYGLAAYCYTQHLGRAMRLPKALDYGMVGINEGVISTTVAPFGGVKHSGLGREGGQEGLDEYMDTQYVYMGA
ncbi:MAG: NAD-dependent succinate-semialdehyde dehydrogenase [Pontibacterium sp.]